MSKQTLYFLRHGQTYFNIFKRIQGWSNSQLTDDGIEVAKKSGNIFKDIPFDLVYSSDLTRALDTTKLFLKAANKDLKIHESFDLREIGFGYFEGLDVNTVWRLANAKAIEQGLIKENETASQSIIIDMIYMMDPYHVAENYNDFLKRINKGILGILKENPDKKHILIVTHSQVIKAIFDAFNSNYKATISVENGSISIISYEDEKFTVEAFNKLEI